MRVLLDENLPIDLALHLTGHEVETVLGFGWGGVKNGELLRRTQGRFDAFITMDRSIQFQQPIARQPFGVLILRARSNRLVDLTPLVPKVLGALANLNPGDIVMIGA